MQQYLLIFFIIFFIVDVLFPFVLLCPAPIVFFKIVRLKKKKIPKEDGGIHCSVVFDFLSSF